MKNKFLSILCIFSTIFNITHTNACENNIEKTNPDLEKNKNINTVNISNEKRFKILVPAAAIFLIGVGLIAKKIIYSDDSQMDYEDNQIEVRGLPNPGVACYMITALQSLYDDVYFRNVVLKCTPSGINKEKIEAVKKIFQYLNGAELLDTDIYPLYKILGYSGNQEDSLDCKGYIEELFDRNKMTNNGYKSRSVFMHYEIPDKLSENIILDHLVNKTDDPSLSSKSTIDINIYRTLNEGTGSVNKNYMDVQENMKFGKNSFELVSINTHLGSSSKSGHYISYVKKNNTWIQRNDNSISTQSWNNIKNDIGRNCVFLRYRKIR